MKVYLGEGAVAKVLEGRAELGSGDVAGAILVDGLEEGIVGIIGGLGSLVVFSQKGGEGLEVQGLGGEGNLAGQLRVVEELLCLGLIARLMVCCRQGI